MTPVRALLSCAIPFLAAAAEPAQPAPAGSAPAQSGAPASRPGIRPLRVEAMILQTREIAYAIETSGSLEADEQKIASELAGAVRELKFEEGDDVKPDQVLAAVDPERYRLMALRAKATYDKEVAQLNEAKTALERRKKLRDQNPGWVPEEEILHYTAQLEAVEAAGAEAKAAWDLAREDERRSQVRSPTPGRIEKRHVVLGQYVAAGAPVATVIDVGTLRLRFKVTESESAKLARGQAVGFRTRALPGQEFPGEIFHVASQADPGTRTVECVARVPNPQGTLRAGYFAEVRIVVERRQKAVAVPENALLPTEKGYVAFVADQGKARERLVTLGLHTPDGLVEIVSGLSEGEQLVTRGAQLLSDGATIEVVAK